MSRKKLFLMLSLIIFVIFLLNFIGGKFYWYYSIWYYDIIMHTLGGFWITLSFLWLFLIKELSFRSILKIFIGVLIIGILWEIFEVLVNETIAQNPFNFLDTVSDIFCDLAGALFAFTYFSKKIIKKEENKL